MVHKSWTDNEILGIIHSNAPEHIARKAWDALVSKYQDELEEYSLELWGGDDFRVSDTLDRALVTARVWITASDEIDDAIGNIRNWLRSILRDQFYRDTGCLFLARTADHNGSTGAGYDWMEDEFTSFEIELSSRKPVGYGEETGYPDARHLFPGVQHFK